MTETLGTIGEVQTLLGLPNPGEVWRYISLGLPVVLPDGRNVVLIADRRYDGGNGPWIVEAVDA